MWILVLLLLTMHISRLGIVDSIEEECLKLNLLNDSIECLIFLLGKKVTLLKRPLLLIRSHEGSDTELFFRKVAFELYFVLQLLPVGRDYAKL